jgi:inner membrane protein
MTARTHDLAAITAFGLIVVTQPVRPIAVATVLAAILANQIGGVAPDIDQPTAPFWRNLPIGKFFGKGIDRLLGGHRFITHSILGLILFGIAFNWLMDLLTPIMPHVDTGIVWWAFMVGMLSHLVMDTFTKEGVPWLLPLTYKFGFPPVKKFRITTGKLAEKLLFIILLAIVVLYCYTNYNHLVNIFHHITY